MVGRIARVALASKQNAPTLTSSNLSLLKPVGCGHHVTN